MHPSFAFIAALALVAAAPLRAQAGGEQIDRRASDAVSVLQGRLPAAEVFSPQFLAAVPESRLRELIAQLESQHGKLTGVDEIKPASPGKATMLLRFERANAAATMAIEQAQPWHIINLLITSVTPRDDGPAKILADFAALPGSTGFAVIRLAPQGPQPVLSLHPARQMAIGSTFKLWVLDTVAEQVERGKLRWDQVVRLGPRSLPSGVTQKWPEGSPVTVETLAIEMISISDNTATDTLIRLAGREAVEARLKATGHADPARNRPFPTTLELFWLKSQSAQAMSAWGAADEAGRRKLLAAMPPGDLANRLDPAMLGTGKPKSIDSIEWFASANDVAGVLQSLRNRADPRALAILGINMGLPPENFTSFHQVGFKGGSEPGVMNLSWLLRTRSGDWLVVSGSWNNSQAALDEARFIALMQRVLGSVR